MLEIHPQNETNIEDWIKEMQKETALSGVDVKIDDNNTIKDCIRRDSWKITKLPKYLVVLIKRFHYDMETGHPSKIDDRFVYQINLDLKPIC